MSENILYRNGARERKRNEKDRNAFVLATAMAAKADYWMTFCETSGGSIRSSAT